VLTEETIKGTERTTVTEWVKGDFREIVDKILFVAKKILGVRLLNKNVG
jgi:hypothetical protein